jgi:hypothetical protein
VSYANGGLVIYKRSLKETSDKTFKERYKDFQRDPLRHITISKNGDYLVGIQEFKEDHIVK